MLEVVTPEAISSPSNKPVADQDAHPTPRWLMPALGIMTPIVLASMGYLTAWSAETGRSIATLEKSDVRIIGLIEKMDETRNLLIEQRRRIDETTEKRLSLLEQDRRELTESMINLRGEVQSLTWTLQNRGMPVPSQLQDRNRRQGEPER